MSFGRRRPSNTQSKKSNKKYYMKKIIFCFICMR
jgi:hypothetical protein